METVYLITLFIAPGMICKKIKNEFKKERHQYDNIYEYLIDVVIDSLAINGCVIAMLNCSMNGIRNFDELFSFLSTFENNILYITMVVITTATWIALRRCLLEKYFYKARNYILKRNAGIEYSFEKTSWDDLMHREGIKDSWMVVSLYKDDKYVTSGMIDSHVTTNAEQFEIILDRVKETEELMKVQPDIFKVDYEYYNTTTGFRVVFYRQKELEEHWPM